MESISLELFEAEWQRTLFFVLLINFLLLAIVWPCFVGLAVAFFPKSYKCCCRLFRHNCCKTCFDTQIRQDKWTFMDVTLSNPGICFGNIELQGYLKPPPLGKPVIICIHGLFGSFDFILNRSCIRPPSDELERYLTGDYGVLGIDLRGHGLSSCACPGGLGALEYRDILKAIDFVQENYPKSPIVLHCQSMGVFSALQAVNYSKRYTDAVSGIISISGLYSVNGDLFGSFKRCGCCFPSFYLDYILWWVKGIIFIFSRSWIEDHEKTSVPTLQFHNKYDPTVPFQQAQAFSDMNGSELVIYEHRCRHLSAHEACVEFHDRIEDFLKNLDLGSSWNVDIGGSWL